MKHPRRAPLTGLVLLSLLGVFGPAHALGAPATADSAATCSALAGTAVSADQIGLPSKGAQVVGATFQPAGGAGPSATGAYCKELAKVAPVDPQSQSITVQVNLPSAWNGEAGQMGGGGLDGFLVTADGAGPGANAQPAPLSLGYGSDGGHNVANPFDVEGQTQTFMNDEVLADYAGDQLKKTHDLAITLIRRFYGTWPRQTYFVGASEGGRKRGRS
jgi:hypothetical protein